MNTNTVNKRLLGPVLAGFFIMGFCDIVAPITGRIAAEFPAESQTAVSFLPTMVFRWFLVLSTPFAARMNRWGRRKTALVGYAFTFVGLLVPYLAGEGVPCGGILPASACSASAIRPFRLRSIRCWRRSFPNAA